MIERDRRRPGTRPGGGGEHSAGPRHGVARALSKRGIASRTVAAQWVRDGRVAINGRVVTDPEAPVRAGRDTISVDGAAIEAAARVYVALNKPRGLVTTARDEQGRDTVYRCLDGANLGWLAPVGRLDRASEGLLLFTNDPAWAARVSGPEAGVHKRYHVQIDRVPDDTLVQQLRAGCQVEGDWLRAVSVHILRTGARNGWLDIVLDEGRNRQIRRMLEALDTAVLRLVRVAIGPVELGDLGKGAWRLLDADEVAALAGKPRPAPSPGRAG